MGNRHIPHVSQERDRLRLQKQNIWHKRRLNLLESNIDQEWEKYSIFKITAVELSSQTLQKELTANNHIYIFNIE